jgi:LysR family transcriptional regulator, regulator for genes of the gallate degradation pathway
VDIWKLNLRHARAAVDIARLGSISAAAHAVSLTQPAITQAIAGLEAQLGTALFERLPSGMVATPAAALLIPRFDAARAHVGSPQVTMSQVRALIGLARHGSYADAAHATGLSQPSLHRAVADLAVVLGKTLVERRGRGIALTAAGKRMARGFRLAQNELEAGFSELAALSGIQSGRITIGAMPLARARLLPRAVSAFHRAHPYAQVLIAEGSHAELVEPMRDGDLDLLIGALRDPAPGPDLTQAPLFEDCPVIIGRREHPLSTVRAPTLKKLSQFPWIVAPAGTPIRAQWQKMFEAAGLALPRVPVECGSVITIRQILLETDFLTLLSPDQVAVELEAGWLTKIADAPAGLVRTIGLTTRTGWRPTALQQAFLDELVSAGIGG